MRIGGGAKTSRDNDVTSRASSQAQAGALSALMQGSGFLVAAIPPWIAAVLHDRTGSFLAGWMLHLICIAAVAALYWRVDPRSYEQAMTTSLSKRDCDMAGREGANSDQVTRTELAT